jgi:hypothetical protein
VPILSHDLDFQRHNISLYFSCSVNEGYKVVIRFVDIGGIVDNRCFIIFHTVIYFNRFKWRLHMLY